MNLIICPGCQSKINEDKCSHAADGGTIVCYLCSSMFHERKNIYRVSSIGPLSCEQCQPRKKAGRNTEKIQCPTCRVKKSELSFNNTKSGVICPQCNHNFIIKN